VVLLLHTFKASSEDLTEKIETKVQEEEEEEEEEVVEEI
jgi:hypothetical protein